MSVKGWLDAALLDRMAAGEEKSGIAEIRRRALAPAAGRVLEIGAGVGANVRHYPEGLGELVLSEPGKWMLRRLRAKVADLGRGRVVEASADALPFEDSSFDCVVSTLVLCTVPDLDKTLAEVRRVLTPEGRFVFAEHVRSDDPRLARWQDRVNPIWRRLAGGCNTNRDTRAAIEGAGFAIGELERGALPRVPPWVKPMILGWASR